MDKQVARKIAFSIEIIDAEIKSEEIALKLISLDEYKKANSIFTYLSKDNEVNTAFIIQHALENNKTVFVPILVANEMEIAQINSSTKYQNGKFDIKEPINCQIINDVQEINISIVPMVAFDPDLNRLGHGKGYYDKWLKKNITFKIGLCFEEKKFDKIPIDYNDVQMDIVISEKKIYCKKQS